jgi:hypothetical protein
MPTKVVGEEQDDVRAMDGPQLGEERARAVAEARFLLPLLEGFPEGVGKEANEDVGVDPLRFLVPNGADGQVALVDPECRLGLCELDVVLPEGFGRPVVDVGPQ